MNSIAEFLWPKMGAERWEYDASAAEKLQREMFTAMFLEPGAFEGFDRLKQNGWM